MTSLGLPLVPSSVMVKSDPTAAAVTSHYCAILGEILDSFQASLDEPKGSSSQLR
jgi:hypothetical protein